MSQKFIGRDVTLYNLAPMDGNGNLGTIVGMLGRWKTLEVTVTKNWADLTPSDAGEPEKRRTTGEWKASAKGFVDAIGSTGLGVCLLNSDYIYCQFLDGNSGLTITLRGGIDSGGATFGQDNGEDNLEFSSKGRINNLPSITYG